MWILTYTHVLYLDVDPKEIQRRRAGDKTKPCENTSVEHLEQWQGFDRGGMEKWCAEKGRPFRIVRDDTDVEQLVRFWAGGEDDAVRKVAAWADRPENEDVDTVLVLDVDKTLSAEDTGEIFSKMIGEPAAMMEIYGGPTVTARRRSIGLSSCMIGRCRLLSGTSDAARLLSRSRFVRSSLISSSERRTNTVSELLW